jgi:hypothetical protein
MTWTWLPGGSDWWHGEADRGPARWGIVRDDEHGRPFFIESDVGDVDIPLRFVGGEPGLRAVGIATETGEVVLR